MIQKDLEDKTHTITVETVPMGYLVAYFRKVEPSRLSTFVERNEESIWFHPALFDSAAHAAHAAAQPEANI